ncbi:MAG: glycosyltransferase family 39 protein [Ignavibacteria bacterium]|nr:glycosyltransferase family 39 protein [Ignavibacteria bacterium]
MIILTAGYVVYLALVVLCFLLFNLSEIKRILIDSQFYFLEINFILIIVGFILLFLFFKNLILTIPRKIIYLLLGITISGVLLTSFVAPQTHRIYYDEDIYENIGQNLATLQKAQLCIDGNTVYGVYYCQNGIYNKQPYAYPYLLSIVYRIFGVSETASFIFNNFLLGFSIIIVFLIAFLLFKNYTIGIFSALMYALIPQNLLWFNTTAAEPSTALFGAMFILSLIIFLKEKSNRSLFLVVVTASFAIQFRQESILLMFVALFSIIIYKPSEFKSIRIYIAGLLFLALSFGYIIHLFVTSGDSWGTTAAKFSLEYFSHNFTVNSLFYIDNIKFPILFTLFFLTSFFAKLFIKEKLLLVIWFLCFWGIFLFFYAGSYGYGADVRYSLVSYVPLVILAGLGVRQLQEFLKNKLSLKSYLSPIFGIIIIISILKFLPQVRAETREAWGARADHLYAKEFATLLPENSIVLTHNPNMFHLWGKNAAQISLATDEKSYVNQILFHQYKDGVYLHWNYWCNADDSLQNSFCNNVLNDYEYELIKEYQENDYNYVLYRIKIKDQGEIPYQKAKYPKLESPIFDPVK